MAHGSGGKGPHSQNGPLVSIKSLPGWQVPTHEDLTRHRLYRPLGEACEVGELVEGETNKWKTVFYSNLGVIYAGGMRSCM